ncbi:hypothetical protein BGW37DRAFT_182719 [Umbelopsis sp. PMI_123]|nr:hypothetical protein BGW37DRAFT_182719 [Umbelopsis sp. PMI_123]
MMAYARRTDPHGSTVGVLLDQEKAYDSVHPEYLTQVMLAIGIPYLLTQCIVKLFPRHLYISLSTVFWLLLSPRNEVFGKVIHSRPFCSISLSSLKLARSKSWLTPMTC